MDYNKAALEMHESHHGKVGIVSKVEVRTRDDLSTAFKAYHSQNLVAEQLVGEGFMEILNNSLSKASYYTYNGKASCNS